MLISKCRKVLVELRTLSQVSMGRLTVVIRAVATELQLGNSTPVYRARRTASVKVFFCLYSLDAKGLSAAPEVPTNSFPPIPAFMTASLVLPKGPSHGNFMNVRPTRARVARVRGCSHSW